MLSCDEARAVLPACEDDDDLEAHVAACEACREERARWERDRAIVREELRALGPSPALAAAVGRIAHETPARTRSGGSRQHGTRRMVLVALAAAAVLVAVLIASRPGREDGPPDASGPAHGDADLDLHLTADGTLVVGGRGRVFALLTPEGEAESPVAFDEIAAELAVLADVTGPRDERGMSELVVLVEAEPDTPWRLVQWTLQLCAHPRVRMHRMRFRVTGWREEALANDLPVDRGIPSFVEERPGPLKVKVFGYDDHTRVRLDELEMELGQGGDEHVLAAIAARVHERLARDGPAVVGEIVAPPPRGGRVPYEHVWRILETLRDAGLEDVLFEGAAMPR